MWTRISLKRALENELKGKIVTNKNISKYLPDESLKYVVFHHKEDGNDDTIDSLIKEIPEGKPGVVYLVSTKQTNESDDSAPNSNAKDEYLWVPNPDAEEGQPKGSYELIGTTRSIFMDEDGSITIIPEDGKSVILGTTDNYIKADDTGLTISGNALYKNISFDDYFSFYNKDAYVFDKLTILDNSLIVTENNHIRWFTDKDNENAFFDVHTIKADDSDTSYQLVWSSDHNLSYINFVTPVKFSGSVSFEGKQLSETLESCVKTDDALYKKLKQLDEDGKLDKLIELIDNLTISENN